MNRRTVPDGTGNGDGGSNVPAHASVGDKFTVFQEYRGYILDGGGHDGTGANPHSRGQKRLSAAYKELLIEIEVMPANNNANAPLMIAPATIAEVMNRVTSGFSDRDYGTGIRAYWGHDDIVTSVTMPKHQVFADQNAAWL